MKFLVSAALVVASSVASAEVGVGYQRLSEGGATTATLQKCGGFAVLKQVYVNGKRLPQLNLRQVENCSRITIDGVTQSQKIDRIGQVGQADVTIFEKAGLNIHRITLSSGSGKTSDTVEVVSFGNDNTAVVNPAANIIFEFGLFSAVLGDQRYAKLSECGGFVKAQVDNLGETIRLVFDDVQSCSKFDILASSGLSVNYPQKKLQVQRNGTFAGSFTIPKKFLELGQNAVKVILRSNSGATDDVILIRFTAL